ncbi:MAG: SurA N-terminal domain-containing protein [Paludibacteraceae bacterium]|nr:SurA N-terminal domain-containing protein [Paludibacteraceae bacterium]
MATLQKIRSMGWVLVLIVGLAMLAFILGDLFTSGSSFFNRNRENIGVIAGQKIHYTEYEKAREQLTEVYKIESGRSDFDEDLTFQIRNQVWQMMLTDYALRAQLKEIGMDVTANELSELCIGENPHQYIRSRRSFMDENGEFSRENLIRFLHNIETMEDDGQNANLTQAKSYWNYWENAVRLTHMQDKYNNLVKNLITANKLDAQYAFDAQNQSVNAQYIVRPYSTIADSTITVKSRDLRKEYNVRKPRYKRKPNRSIEYVQFAIVPSEADFAAAKQAMDNLREEFATTDDIALVVNTNSDVMYDGRNYSENTIPEQYKEFGFGKNAKKDAVTDIEFADDTYRMARLVECGYSMPDSVKLKLIATQEGQEDQEIGWLTEDMLTREIAEPAFTGKKGTRFTVAVGLGEQTFEIMDVAKATPKVKLAVIERKVTPSSRTYSALYNQAKQFIVANNTEEAFRQAVQEQNMQLYPAYNLDKNADKVGDLKSSRTIVRWAYDAKEGQVSDVFECGDKYVVALLTQVNDGEYRSMEEVEGELRQQVIKHKKAGMMYKEMKQYTSLEEAAQAYNLTVQTAENVTMGGYRFGNAGAEPVATGTAFAVAANTLSRPFEGNAGMYMLVPGEKVTAEATFDEKAEIQRLNNTYAYRVYQIQNWVLDQTEVTDNRANFQ